MDLSKLAGKNVFVRTITHYYTGVLAGQIDGQHMTWLELTDAAWIADTGRFSDALATGSLEEVEPYPDDLPVYLSSGAIVDICEWPHDLPRVRK